MLARVILFIIVGGGGILSLFYTTSHFKKDRQIVLLNTTRPDFHKLVDLDKEPQGVVSRRGLREYVDYFNLVSEAMPDNNEALFMLGYLYQITGDKTKAQGLLTKACQQNPPFFFTEFNLALVLFEQGNYAQSTEVLKKALLITPDVTLNRMMNSIVYRQIFASMDNKQDIITGLRRAYRDAYVLLIESLSHSGQAEGATQVSLMAEKMFPEETSLFKDLQGENARFQISAHII